MFYTGFVASVSPTRNRNGKGKKQQTATQLFLSESEFHPRTGFFNFCFTARPPPLWRRGEIDGFIKHPPVSALPPPEKEVVKGIFISLFSFSFSGAGGAGSLAPSIAFIGTLQYMLYIRRFSAVRSLSLFLSLSLSLALFVFSEARDRPSTVSQKNQKREKGVQSHKRLNFCYNLEI